jgi:hypothetical protein
MADGHKAGQGGVPPGRADYLPDSRILTPADKAEREALLKAFGANLRRVRLTAEMTQRELAACPSGYRQRELRLPARDGHALAESRPARDAYTRARGVVRHAAHEPADTASRAKRTDRDRARTQRTGHRCRPPRSAPPRQSELHTHARPAAKSRGTIETSWPAILAVDPGETLELSCVTARELGGRRYRSRPHTTVAHARDSQLLVYPELFV